MTDRYPADARRCDGCGAICTRSIVSQTREVRADGTTDVASFFETAPRFVSVSQLSAPARLTWCCECHRAGSYCLPDAHETRKIGERDFDRSRMVTVRPGQTAPRCLVELAGAPCDLAARGIAHAHGR